MHAGTPGSGLLYGATLVVVLRAFANGGSSLTGLEAISNGVATFRKPEGRNARRVLVIMSCILGTLVLGVSILAHVTHAVPYVSGSPTVVSQEAKYVFSTNWYGKLAFYFVQFATMLILWTGANTSFNGFPNLASFVAEDAFLPRQLTRRGHRLVFSNGIIILTIASIILLVGTDAQLNILVGVYAVGVFTGFTMAGAGMVKHHLTLKEPGWRHRIAINGFAAVLSFSVVLIFVVVKFREGVWIVVVLFAILVPALIKLHSTYTEEQQELEENAASAAVAPILRRHVVLVFVERLDLAAARALQYARTLNPDELRAVHFVLDTAAARELRGAVGRARPQPLPARPGRVPGPPAHPGCDGARGRGGLGRADRGQRPAAAAGLRGGAAPDPARPHLGPDRRVRQPAPERQRHDRALPARQAPARARALAAGRGGRPGGRHRQPPRRAPHGTRARARPGRGPRPSARRTSVPRPRRARRRARSRSAACGGASGPASQGRVRSVRVQPRAGVPSLECTIADASGQLMLVFQGRRRVPGIEPGARLVVEGMVGERGRFTAMVNPLFWILSTPESDGGDAESPPT